MKKLILSISAVVSSLLILSSCSINNGTTQPPQGAFLLAQVSPDAPTVGFYVNNSLFDTLRFNDFTRYLGANPGSYKFTVDSFGSTTAVLDNNINIDANKFYSYFIIDSFNKVKSAFITDVFQKPSGDSVYVRFFNFCPNTTEPLSLVNSDSSAWSQGRTFNDQSNPQFIAFSEKLAGTYNLSLKTVSGTVLKTQTLALAGGKVYTLFAKGIQGSTDSTKALSIGQLENYPQQ